MFDFDRHIDRKNSDSIKWKVYDGQDVLPFWVADMDFPTPEFILDALRTRLDHPILGYATPPQELSTAFIDWAARRFSWTVEEEWLVWLPAVVPGIKVALRSIGKSNDACVLPIPTYPPFLSLPGLQDRRSMSSQLVLSNDQWVMDLDDLRNKLKHAATLLISNPQNPTGRAYSKDELQALGELCIESETTIISDEIHWGIILDENVHHIPIASISSDLARNVVTLISHTKSYNVPGVPCAVAIITDSNIRENFVYWRDRMLSSCSPLALAAALAAFQDKSTWLTELNETLCKNRDLLVQTVNELACLSMTVPQATHLGWIDARSLPVEHKGLHFVQHGLGLYDGEHFLAPGFVRFNFAVPESLLNQGLERLRNSVEALI